ncbi:hypothetical protein D3C71_1738020 [compost metagenome]
MVRQYCQCHQLELMAISDLVFRQRFDKPWRRRHADVINAAMNQFRSLETHLAGMFGVGRDRRSLGQGAMIAIQCMSQHRAQPQPVETRRQHLEINRLVVV